jgi:hypothetical protein
MRELLRSTGKLSPRTGQSHPHSKGIDDALHLGAGRGRPPKATPAAHELAVDVLACLLQWGVRELVAIMQRWTDGTA